MTRKEDKKKRERTREILGDSRRARRVSLKRRISWFSSLSPTLWPGEDSQKRTRKPPPGSHADLFFFFFFSKTDRQGHYARARTHALGTSRRVTRCGTPHTKQSANVSRALANSKVTPCFLPPPRVFPVNTARVNTGFPSCTKSLLGHGGVASTAEGVRYTEDRAGYATRGIDTTAVQRRPRVFRAPHARRGGWQRTDRIVRVACAAHRAASATAGEWMRRDVRRPS